MIPSASAPVLLMSNGLIQENDGSIAPAGFWKHTLRRATTAKMPRMTTSAPSRNHCVLADASMFANIHPRYLTPSTSTIYMGALSVIWYVGLTIISESILFASIAGLGLMIAFYYALTGYACPIYYRHHLRGVKNALFIGLSPIIGALILTSAFFRSATISTSRPTDESQVGSCETIWWVRVTDVAKRRCWGYGVCRAAWPFVGL